jgi:hypothetical protein
VPTGNAEVFEMMEITHVPPTRLNVHLLTVISVFRSAFRSRAAAELEDFALQLNVLKRSLKRRPRVDVGRPAVVGRPLATLSGLALGADHRPTRNRNCLASQSLSPVLDLESSKGSIGPTCRLPRGPRFDPADEPSKSSLGRSPHPWRAA